MKVHDKFQKTDGNGGFIEYKVTARPERWTSRRGKQLKKPVYDVAYVSRKNGRGRFTGTPATIAMKDFRELIA